MDTKSEIITEIYAAISRNDIDAALKLFDPEIERIEPQDFPTPGTYRGHNEMKAHLIKGRSTWAEGACLPERFIFAGDKVVVIVHVHVRLEGETKWIDARIADGFTFKNGKVIQMNSFTEKEHALNWAGIDEET